MNVREIALRILMDVEQGKKSHLALAEAENGHPELEERDRRFLRRLVHGTLEERLLLDARLNRKSRVPVMQMKPLIRAVLRMSVYQLFFMDKIPHAAVINEAVKLVRRARMQGLAGFVNGVLRAVERETEWPAESEEVRAGIPQWILDKWKRELGPEACSRMTAAFREPSPVWFRLPYTVSPEELLRCLAEDGAEAEPAPFPDGAWELHSPCALSKLRAFQKGWICIQDISSMTAGIAAAPEPESMILDVCAAPGGKSLHAADLLRGTGMVISCDLTEGKVRRIRENLERTGLANMETRVQDARVFVPEWEEAFDLVLADLPCSGLGVIGRKPEIRYLVTPKEIDALQKLQRQILKNVVRYIRPGGALLYSTCTVTEEENGENRRWILENTGLRAESVRDVLPQALREEPSAEEGWLRLLPGKYPCDGFYLAKFRKPGESGRISK